MHVNGPGARDRGVRSLGLGGGEAKWGSILESKPWG